MDSQVLFGSRIRSIREAAALSREIVAEKSDINPNYLGEIERGEKWPSIEVIQRLAGALSVSPSAFLEFEAEELDSNVLLANLNKILGNSLVDLFLSLGICASQVGIAFGQQQRKIAATSSPASRTRH